MMDLLKTKDEITVDVVRGKCLKKLCEKLNLFLDENQFTSIPYSGVFSTQ